MASSAKDILAFMVVFLSCTAFGQHVEEPAFFDTPPSDYYNRSSLRDCPTRFYTTQFYRTPYVGPVSFRAFRGEFQHMVAIGWTRSNESIDYLCGGTLITNDFILTAAHCVGDSDNISPDTVRIGDTDLGSPEDDEFAQQIAIARFIPHPQYRGSRRYFDIALVQLKEPATYTSAVCNACLWRELEIPSGPMDAIGFGATGFGEALSPTLQRAELNMIDMANCTKRITLSRRQMPDGFRTDQFCAVGNSMDTCEGDSGGPIGVKRLDVQGYVFALIVGVVSFGTPCSVGSTGVYSKVSQYADWIEQVTNTSFDYIECTSRPSCSGRVHKEIPVNLGTNFAQNRFGLLWDNVTTLYECGATLIDYQYFLTSASCVTTNKGYPRYVAQSGTVLITVADVYVSPKYRLGRPENNIALIKVAKYVNTRMLRPACLWNRNTDGVWPSGLQFSAYGTRHEYEVLSLPLVNTTVFVDAEPENECGRTGTSANDVVCFKNDATLIPGVCEMDYGAAVINSTVPPKPVFAYGVVSTLSKGCGMDLYMNDVTPHFEWIESIIVHRRNRFLVFSN